jgi:hypothetical protein
MRHPFPIEAKEWRYLENHTCLRAGWWMPSTVSEADIDLCLIGEIEGYIAYVCL